jgi:hypothetical protein
VLLDPAVFAVEVRELLMAAVREALTVVAHAVSPRPWAVAHAGCATDPVGSGWTAAADLGAAAANDGVAAASHPAARVVAITVATARLPGMRPIGSPLSR